MTHQVRTFKRYSISFQQRVVKEIEEESISISVMQRRYDIRGGETIQNWIRKFGKTHLLNQIIRIETMEEKDRIKQLEEEIKRLKLALADSLLAKDCLEVVIDEANKEYKTDLKKNFGSGQSKNSKKDIK